MSLLNFLRVIDEIRSGSGKRTPLPRNRKLELEALERRSVLTLLDPVAYVLEPPESITTTTTFESLPATDPASTNYEQSPPLDMGESGSGTGEPEAGDLPSEPPPEPLPSTGGSGGGSGSGSGDPSPEPPPEPGSGSGSGGAAPVIDSLSSQSGQFWFWLVGTVSDADNSVDGLMVLFTIGDATIPSFTAVVQEDGTFCSMQLVYLAGTQIHVQVVDYAGNASEIVTWTV
jgi:hypothetical protein